LAWKVGGAAGVDDMRGVDLTGFDIAKTTKTLPGKVSSRS